MIRVTRQGNKLVSDNNGEHQATTNSVTDSTTAHYYKLAGQSLVFQNEVDALSAFSAGSASESYSKILNGLAEQITVSAAEGKLKYQGFAPFDNVMRDVKYWEYNHLFRIDVDDLPICLVDVKNQHIHVLNEASFDQRLNLEVVTGPAVIVLLALKGVYCLHAGAIATEFGNIAFIAESGVGKSTLSAHIDTQWQQLADDILPIHLRSDRYQIFDYPQLKLPVNATELPQPQNCTLDLIIRLSAEESDTIEFSRLPRTDALIQIVRHTVAARLFDTSLMIEHSRFAKFLSGEIPVVELKYPRDLTRLNQLRFAILKYLRKQEYD